MGYLGAFTIGQGRPYFAFVAVFSAGVEGRGIEVMMISPRSPRNLIAAIASTAFACGVEGETESTKAPLEVEAIPHGHTFEGQTTVELTSSRPAQIFFSLAGEDPIGPSGQRYEGPIELQDAALVTFVAISDDGIWSEPRTELYRPAPDDSTPALTARALEIDRNNHFFSAPAGSDDLMYATFTARSVGLDRVVVSDLYIGVNPTGWGFFEDDVFTIVDHPGVPLTLAPGEALELTVAYRPTATLRSAVLVFASDDERSSEGYRLVELWGRVITW